jgi:membrane protein implicated in regulation of membrane protease activity
MSKAYFLMMCALFALVMGVPWGAFIYWFHPAAGLWVGVTLFFGSLLALVNLGREFDKETDLEEQEAESDMHNRRFNDA